MRKRLAVNAFNAVLVDRHAKSPASAPPLRGNGQNGDRVASARHTLEMLLEALGTGNSLIVFPEGTRGDGLQVGPFKSGIYYLWRERPDVQFVPVYLSNLNRILPKGEFLPVPVISRVTFGAPLRLETNETKESFLSKAHTAVCALKDV